MQSKIKATGILKRLHYTITMGRKKLIKTSIGMWDLFRQYNNEIKANPILVHDYVGKDGKEIWRRKERPLTMVGFENYVKQQGGPVSLDQYFANRDNRYAEFVSICSRIKKGIQADQIEGGMVGIYNPSITQRLNSLTEKNNIRQVEQPLFVDSTDKYEPKKAF